MNAWGKNISTAQWKVREGGAKFKGREIVEWQILSTQEWRVLIRANGHYSGMVTPPPHGYIYPCKHWAIFVKCSITSSLRRFRSFADDSLLCTVSVLVTWHQFIIFYPLAFITAIRVLCLTMVCAYYQWRSVCFWSTRINETARLFHVDSQAGPVNLWCLNKVLVSFSMKYNQYLCGAYWGNSKGRRKK